MFRRVRGLEFLCRNACPLSLCIWKGSVCSCGVCSVPVDLKFDLLLCWKQGHACDASSMKDSQLNWDRHTNSMAYYLSWNCCHFPAVYFLGENWKPQLQEFPAFSENAIVMKPLYLNSWGQCLCSVKYDLVWLWFSTHDSHCGFRNSKMKSPFSQEKTGEKKMGREQHLLTLHQRWASELCCTCQRPFVQLSLHSAADALHTLASVNCCQAHLWPSVKGQVLRFCHHIQLFNTCFCQEIAVSVSLLQTDNFHIHSFCCEVVVILVKSSIRIHWDISFSFLGVLSFAVTSEPQMWFTWNVLPASSLPVKATTEARACWIWMKGWADLLSCSGSALSAAIVWRQGWGWTRLLYTFWRGWCQTIHINGAYWQFLCYLFTQAFLFDFNLTLVLHSANQETIKY